MCTALEKLKQDGVKEGIEIVIKAMISKRFSVSELSDIFNTSEEEIMKITENSDIEKVLSLN